MATLSGYAVVFSSLSENLGGFVEQIAPGAVDRTIREAVDLRALRGHDPDKLLGRVSAGTLTVAKDRRGLQVAIDTPATPLGEETVELVRRGDLSSMSFAFVTLEDSWDDRGRVPTRTVLNMEMREVSIVCWPAYLATEVSVRAALPRSLRPRPRPTTVSGRLQEAMSYRSLEYAMTKTTDGRAVPHDEARQSLARFLEARKAAGRRPVAKDGTPLSYRSTRTPDGWRGEWVSPGLRIADARQRMDEQAKTITRQEKPR